MPEDKPIAQANEFTRTPFRSPFGYTHPERCKTEICPYCKNEDTRRMNGLELLPYEQYHAGNPFKAFECHACGSKFHFATPTPSKPEESSKPIDGPNKLTPAPFCIAYRVSQRMDELAGRLPQLYTPEEAWECLTNAQQDIWHAEIMNIQ